MKSSRFLIASILLNVVVLIGGAWLILGKSSPSPEPPLVNEPSTAAPVQPLEEPLAVTAPPAPPDPDPASPLPVVASEPAEAAPVIISREKVDPTQPGNFMTLNGVRVAIIETTRSEGAEEDDLVIEVTPLPAGQKGAPTADNESTETFTSEEESFRAKWGWNTFSEVQAAALQATSQTSPSP